MIFKEKSGSSVKSRPTDDQRLRRQKRSGSEPLAFAATTLTYVASLAAASLPASLSAARVATDEADDASDYATESEQQNRRMEVQELDIEEFRRSALSLVDGQIAMAAATLRDLGGDTKISVLQALLEDLFDLGDYLREAEARIIGRIGLLVSIYSVVERKRRRRRERRRKKQTAMSDDLAELVVMGRAALEVNASDKVVIALNEIVNELAQSQVAIRASDDERNLLADVQAQLSKFATRRTRRGEIEMFLHELAVQLATEPDVF